MNPCTSRIVSMQINVVRHISRWVERQPINRLEWGTRIAFLLVGVGGCTMDAASRQSELAEAVPHGDIAAYATEAESTVVVVMAPSDCVACNSALGDWILWGSDSRSRRLVVLFSSRPTEAERRTLAATRIRASDVLPTGAPSVRSDVAVYAFVAGALQDSAVGQKGSLALLARLKRGPVVTARE